MTKGLRFCVPEIAGRRGAGLGNELHGWAKAYLASEELSARLLHPAWALNPRGYRKYWGTGRTDWMWQRILKAALPTYRFDLAAYRSTGETDFGKAVRVFADAKGLDTKSAFVLLTGGMWGGFPAISRAFHFVRTQLYSSRGTLDNLLRLRSQIDPRKVTIAIHVRRGDFSPPSSRGRFPGTCAPWNQALPLDWYEKVCRTIARKLDAPHQFVLFTDGEQDEVGRLLREVNPITPSSPFQNACSDLLAMAESDLLVCSLSSFSLWAAALSGNPYLWHRSSMYERDGSLQVWDHGVPVQAVGSGGVSDPARGVPVADDGDIPDWLIRFMRVRAAHRDASRDLIFYGRLPVSGS